MDATDILCPDCGLPFAIGQLVKVSAREADAIGYPFTRRTPAVVAGAYPDLDELGVIEPGDSLHTDIYRSVATVYEYVCDLDVDCRRREGDRVRE